MIDLLRLFREDVAPDLQEYASPDCADSACTNILNHLSWDEYKRLYYQWKFNRDIGGSNEGFLVTDESLYFPPPDVDLVNPEN